MIALDLGPRFALGRVVMTHGACHAIPRKDAMDALERFARGDWGDVDRQDAEQNDRVPAPHAPLFAVFHASNGATFWIVTDANRSVTTLLLPDEY